MADKYTTVSGDMWDMVAYKLWGDESLFPELIKANLSHVDTVVFSAGVALNIPEIDTTAGTSKAPWSDV